VVGERQHRAGDAVEAEHPEEGDADPGPRLDHAQVATREPPAAPAAEARDPELDLLTRREHEVVQHLARGYTYKEIAAELHISARTVESHASAVLRKLQVSSRHQLAHWAARRRLI
jgi:DNA-binding NarL/FixJ family response regulator